MAIYAFLPGERSFPGLKIHFAYKIQQSAPSALWAERRKSEGWKCTAEHNPQNPKEVLP